MFPMWFLVRELYINSHKQMYKCAMARISKTVNWKKRFYEKVLITCHFQNKDNKEQHMFISSDEIQINLCSRTFEKHTSRRKNRFHGDMRNCALCNLRKNTQTVWKKHTRCWKNTLALGKTGSVVTSCDNRKKDKSWRKNTQALGKTGSTGPLCDQEKNTNAVGKTHKI